MSESGVDTLVWQEFQRQLDLKGLKIEQGMIQDATFVYAEPGHCNKDTPRGEQAKKRRDKDGKIMSKNGKMHYGYKLHTIMDMTHNLIRRIETTKANVHDSQVDLSEKGRPFTMKSQVVSETPAKPMYQRQEIPRSLSLSGILGSGRRSGRQLYAKGYSAIYL